MIERTSRLPFIIGLVLCIIIFCCSCGNPAAEVKQGSRYSVADDKGHTVYLADKPRRVLTLALATDEMVLSMIPPERMAAVSALAKDDGISTVSGAARKVSAVMEEYKAEQILSFHPDLVIAPDWIQDNLLKSLRDLGLTVYVVRGSLSVEDTKVAVKEIAAVLGEEKRGDEIIAGMDRDLERVRAIRENIPEGERKIVIQYSHMKGYVGKGTLFDDLCSQAGVINGASAIGLGKSDLITPENLIAMNPDVIFIPSWAHGDISPESVTEELLSNPALETIQAVRNKNFAQVPDKYLFSASPDMTKAILGIQEAAYGKENIEKWAGKAG